MNHEGLPPSYDDSVREPSPSEKEEFEAFVLSATQNEGDKKLLADLGVRCLRDLFPCSRAFLAKSGMTPSSLEKLMEAISSRLAPAKRPAPADLESYLEDNGMKKYRHILRSKGVTSLARFGKLSQRQLFDWLLEADVPVMYDLVLAAASFR